MKKIGKAPVAFAQGKDRERKEWVGVRHSKSRGAGGCLGKACRALNEKERIQPCSHLRGNLSGQRELWAFGGGAVLGEARASQCYWVGGTHTRGVLRSRSGGPGYKWVWSVGFTLREDS